MGKRLKFITTAKQEGERLDKVVVEFLGDSLTRSQIQILIHDEAVKVDQAVVKPGVRMKIAQVIEVTLPDPPATDVVVPQDIALDVVYEDEDLAVINKPAGLVVHPGTGVADGTLVNAILARYPEIAQMNYAPQRRGIVHRLDKDTSGLILVARRASALHHLSAQFQKRTVEKHYLALLERTPLTMSGRITAPIMRDPNNRRKMIVMRGGRPAISEYHVQETFADGRALVDVKLLTGRTHQIRVHMIFINCPIVGDVVYGWKRPNTLLKRQFLHARRLCFDHPQTGERMCFESGLPTDLENVLNRLREPR